MLETILDVQIPLLALALLSAAAAKLAVREPPPGEGPVAIGLRNNRLLAIGLVCAESALGIGLLTSTHMAIRICTALGFAGALWVVGELKARRPDSGCGCFGGLSSTRIGKRTIVRTALFAVVAVIALPAPHTGVEVLRHAMGLHGILLAAELACFMALSPEVGVALGRQRSRVPCELRPAPLATTYDTLHASGTWRSHQELITGIEPIDVWRELCWRFLVYQGRRDDEDVHVVFAVSLDERDPVVKVAIVDADADAGADAGMDADLHDDEDEDDGGGGNSGPNPMRAVPV